MVSTPSVARAVPGTVEGAREAVSGGVISNENRELKISLGEFCACWPHFRHCETDNKVDGMNGEFCVKGSKL